MAYFLRRSKPQVEETVVPWRVYPRADYFKNRFISVYQRVEKLNFLRKSPFKPSNFDEVLDDMDRDLHFKPNSLDEVLDEMHRAFFQFSSNIKVVVYSETQLGNETYVTDTRPMENWKSDGSKDEKHSLNVYIQHLKSPENPPYRWPFQKVMDTLYWFMGWEKEMVPVMSAPPVNGPHFIAVDFDDHMSPAQREEFLIAVKKRSKTEETRICIVNDKVLSMRIEEYLEDQIMARFSKLSNYLNGHSLSTARFPPLMHEMRFRLVYRQKKWDQYKFSREIEDKLIEDLTDTFYMSHSASRNLLEELDFHKTVHHIVNWEDGTRWEDRGYKFVLNVSHRLEEKLEPIYKRQTETLRKFVFEIHRYLQQTRIQGYEPKLTPTSVVKVPEKMRSELLALENVYSVATVFGEFQIHLYDKELHSDKTTLIVDEDDSDAVPSAHVEGKPGLADVEGKPGLTDVAGDKEAIETKLADMKLTFPTSDKVKMAREAQRLMADARKAIGAILTSHKFNSPYCVKVISSLPSHHIEDGKAICCPWVNDPANYRKGTLGGFIDLTGQDNHTSLYGLTCAHVVNSNEDDFNVFVISERDEQMLFATSSPRMTIEPGSHRDFPLVDIAAIKVVDPVRQHCTRMLKDIDGNYWPYKVFNDRGQDSAVGSCVHKYGATTNLTEGIVASTDMIISGTGEQYLVLVEPLPGSSTTEKFSDRGDSGSITCMMEPGHPNNHTTITALSMVSGGDMTFEGEELSYTLSFMLQTGLDLLNEQLTVNIPPQ